MYNGIGLTTPRGSGTNGHVQRNWAFVRLGKKDNSNYRSEEDIKKLDATLNRPPNKDILDHDRKRKIEVKCLEFEEILERQGLSSDEIKTKVESYRKKLMGQGKADIPKDEFGRIAVRDSHQIAEAQQEKNAKLREAFNISEYFVEGSSFDSDRKAKEDLAKSLALQKELDTQRDQTAAAVSKEKELSKRHPLERTPSMDHDISSAGLCASQADNGHNTIKKKKKKRTREISTSPERKKDKKKKSKKRKKESKAKKSKKSRKHKDSESDCNPENYKESVDEDSGSEIDADVKKSRKKWKRDKKKRRNKKKEASSSSDISRSSSPMSKHLASKKPKTSTEKTSSDNDIRSRSDIKSLKPKESRNHHYESSRYSRDRIKVRSKSRSGKNSSSRRHRGDLRDLNLSPDYRSREQSDADNNSKNHDKRNSRSRQRSKHEIQDESIKTFKRQHCEEYSKRKRDSSSIAKRKRYSRSLSPPISSRSHHKNYLAKTTEIDSSLHTVHSKTPRHKSQVYQKKKSKSRSRSRSSSVKESLRKKSRTPLPRTSRKCESRKTDTKTFSNHNKADKTNSSSFSSSGKKLDSPKSRSRNTSRSSSNISSTDTGTFKSRTPSPKKQHLEKNYAPKGYDQQKPIDERKKSLTPTLPNRRSTSNSKSGHLLNEKSRKDTQCSNSRTEELPDKSKETEGDIEKMSYRTPPSKIEKKALSPRSSRDSSELSYSPATRNPERYRDIIENTKNHKTEKSKIGDKDEDIKDIVKSSKQSDEREWDRREKVGKNDKNQAKPVVRLQSQSDEDSDSIERNTEKILDEFQEFKRETDLKDLKMLEQLKTDIAAKAKEKIKTIEKMAASTSACSISNNDGEVSDKSYKRTIRNSLNDFLAANNVAPAVVATCSPTDYNNIPNSPPGAIYPQTLEEIKKEQEFVLLKETSNEMENKNNNKDNERQVNCKKSLVTASGHAVLLSPTASPLHNNVNVINKERDRKRERDIRERERERETNYFNNDRYLEKRQRSSPNFFSTSGCGGTTGIMVGGRRNINNSMLNINHRQQRLNVMCNSSGVGGHHHHSHMHPHHNHPNHKIVNNHHSSSSSTIYVANNSNNPHTLICNHSNNSTNLSFHRPSRINNTPLITATQFNNQMLSKQSNSILVNRRDHRTALNLGLSGTPCTNFSNSNLLLTKANNNSHHLHTAAVSHVVSGGHHHQYHHHHHHRGQSSIISNNPATQITDRILIAASIAAAQRHSLSVHSATSSAAAVAAANNLNFLQQQTKPKLVIKPFKINDSQPLVAALADSSLVDAIVSKVSTATVAAAESAARRSRSRSRRSQSRNRHEDKTGSGGSNSGRGGGERDGNRRRSTSRSRSSRSSTYSRSRSRTPSHRSMRSHSTQSSSSSHTSSRSSSSSSSGSSRSGTRSPSIPRRRGSPSFLDRRRITSRHSSSRDRRH